jgi:hypothetical protein
MQNLGLCSALRTLEQGGIFILPHLLWNGTSFFSSLIRRTAPFSRLLRHRWGCWGSILTRILTLEVILNGLTYIITINIKNSIDMLINIDCFQIENGQFSQIRDIFVSGLHSWCFKFAHLLICQYFINHRGYTNSIVLTVCFRFDFLFFNM